MAAHSYAAHPPEGVIPASAFRMKIAFLLSQKSPNPPDSEVVSTYIYSASQGRFAFLVPAAARDPFPNLDSISEEAPMCVPAGSFLSQLVVS